MNSPSLSWVKGLQLFGFKAIVALYDLDSNVTKNHISQSAKRVTRAQSAARSGKKRLSSGGGGGGGGKGMPAIKTPIGSFLRRLLSSDWLIGQRNRFMKYWEDNQNGGRSRCASESFG